jgi:S-DNA-T family DNA segregation ATPase FtsK/SpoIIIE
MESAKASLPVTLGLADEPHLQRQSPVVVDIVSAGHILICGGAMSGKTTLIETLLISAARLCPQHRLNIYIADYASRLLSVFGGLPHVGGIVLAEEDDKAEKLLKLLSRCIVERKMKFAEKGVGSYRDYSQIENDLPIVLFVIDGLPEFVESNLKSEERILTIAKEGASLGIYMVASCGGVGEIKGRLKGYFLFNIGLGLGDKFDYSQTLGERCEIAAEKNIPGRGMIKTPAPAEFQVAMPVAASPERFRAALVEEVEMLAGKYGDSGVMPIPHVPEMTDYEGFMSDVYSRGLACKDLLPIGYDVDEAEIVMADSGKMFCYLICGQQRTGKTNALKMLMRHCKESGAKTYLFDDAAASLASFAKSIEVDRHFASAGELYQFAREILIPEFSARGGKGSSGAGHEPIYVFIHDLLSFSDAVNHDDYPMSGFFESIFNSGSSLNIHFVGVMLVTAVNERIYTNAIRNFIAWNSGILLGGKVIEQNVLEFDVPLYESSKKLPAGVGYTLSNGRAVKVKLPFIKEDTE